MTADAAAGGQAPVQGSHPDTIGGLLRESVQRHPDKLAVTAPRGADILQLTYGELDAAANRVANALVRDGHAKSSAKPGARLAMMAPNDLDYPILHFGAARAGCPLAHVSIRANAAGRAAMLQRVDAEILFVHRDFAEEARALLTQVETLKQIVTVGGAEGPDTLSAFIGDEEDHDPPVMIDPDDPAAITFSSGSTGEPKGVLVSHRNRALSSSLGADAFELLDDDILGCTTPLFHVAGLFLWFQLGIRRGCTIVLLPKWAPDVFANAVEKQHVTAAFLVPTQVTALLNDPASAARISGLRYLNISGAPTPIALLNRAMETWPEKYIVEHYGQSESCPLAYRPAAYNKTKPTSVGRPCVEMAVLGAHGQPLPQGDAGEVATRGDHLLIRYIGDDSGTRDLYAGDGWLKTGDVGRIDEDGFLHLIDRSKDIIISGGENIFPAEVERALYQHPAVEECAVFGVPHDEWGEVPAAHVVMTVNGVDEAPDEAPDEAALIAFVETKIPRYKRPRFIKFVDALPRTAIGKIQKNVIRAEYWVDRDRVI